MASGILQKNPIFEWDEDLRYGSHYHVFTFSDQGKHIKNSIHYRAGDPVPEPWNYYYFGGN